MENKAKVDGNINMTLYDMNKNIVSQLIPLDKKELKHAIIVLNNYHKAINNNYYMLLCNDYHYYTLFTKSSEENNSFGSTVMEIAHELGEIVSVEENEEKAIEIWIKCEDKTARMFLLFPYDQGVVKYNG